MLILMDINVFKFVTACTVIKMNVTGDDFQRLVQQVRQVKP